MTAPAHITLHRLDAHRLLDVVEPHTVQCTVTSVPYWGLRTYGDDPAELGRENLQDYLDHMVTVFAQVRQALTRDGLLWLNIGDTAAGSGGAGGDYIDRGDTGRNAPDERRTYRQGRPVVRVHRPADLGVDLTLEQLIPGQWCNIPGRLAAALQADGWLLRSWVTWAKTTSNGRALIRPESLKHANRPGVSSEVILMLAPHTDRSRFYPRRLVEAGNVWHFPARTGRYVGPAPFPDELPRRCIIPSTLPGDLVLDPFAGSGTTLRVAAALGRPAVGIDLYADEVPA